MSANAALANNKFAILIVLSQCSFLYSFLGFLAILSRFCVCSFFLLYQQPLKRGFWFLQKVKLNFGDQLTIPDLFYSSLKNWPWCSFRFDPPDLSPPPPPGPQRGSSAKYLDTMLVM